jgi:hypothetical protein|tara:strand:- start:476 stop:628 length:153 start_codon:yes stop_codon:yes gene_type:complete
MPMDIEKSQMKERIMNYLDYMDEKDMQEIAAQLYNISKRRDELKRKKENE